METLNGVNPVRPTSVVGLPSINHLDGDRIKREEGDYQGNHSAPASTMVSPSHPFPGALHAFNNHQSLPATSLPATAGGLLSPPASRRTSNEEFKDQRPVPRQPQPLPSIHEALGPEPPLSYPPPPPPPQVPVSVSQSYYSPPSTAPHAEHRPRSFSIDHINGQGPLNPYATPRSPFQTKPVSTLPPPPPPPAQQNHKLPSLHPIKTTQSPPVPATRSTPAYPPYTPSSSSAYQPLAPPASGPMNPPYRYSMHPAEYPLSAPPPGPFTPRYPPSETYSAPPGYPPNSWRPDNADFSRSEEKKRSSLAHYGDSVKRHLERFDLEASLNEMAEGAGRVADFSKVYRQRAHETQRTGMTLHAMPRLEEVDEMLKNSEKIQISLQRMRQVVVNHQQAALAEPQPEAMYRPVNGYSEHPPTSQEEAKASAPYPDSNKKQKRGRAAPPGRCHSCNRAETPEWRRGPDGARTLCNACGLHYAKVTRKLAGRPPAGSLRSRLAEGSSAT